MTISEHMNNLLKFSKDSLSVVELANAKCLPPVLHVSNIALLMYPESINLQEFITLTLKKVIDQGNIPAITAEEFKQFIADHESRRDTAKYVNTKAEGKLPAITLNAVAHADLDLLPEDIDVNFDERLMYVVHRKDMKKWLESENDWPLPEDNLLSRWWPEVNSEGKWLPLTAEALKSSTADQDVKKVIDPTSTKKVAVENIFRKEGQIWTLSYKGTEGHLKKLKGLSYISYLLGSPHQEYHVTEITKAAGDPDKEFLSFSSSEVSTKETIANYRGRLKRLNVDLADAERKGEKLVIKEIEQEKEALENQIKQALGFGGKLKKNSDEVKKQANAVSNAIRRAIEAIYDLHPSLGQHLSNTIHRGQYLSYQPVADISWATSQ